MDVIYSNDFTNIWSETEFRIKTMNRTDIGYLDKINRLIRESVCEAKDIAGVHILQPGLGWVPAWRSTVYPIQSHIEFKLTNQQENIEKDPWVKFLVGGRDPVCDFIKECTKHKIKPILSLRLNDVHSFKDSSHSWSQFYWKNYHKRIGNVHDSWGNISHHWNDRGLNWMHKSIRDYKFALIQELINYEDTYGIELDFMRHTRYFQEWATTKEEREEIILNFVKRVKSALRDEQKLAIRIPAYLETYDPIGINLKRLKKVVDIITLSSYYFTTQVNDAKEIKERIGEDAKVYLEMTHTTLANREPYTRDLMHYERTTKEEFLTTAKLAQEASMDGVSIFNFAYYRKHGAKNREPFSEPPFEVLEMIRNDNLGEHYHFFEKATWNAPHREHKKLPAILTKGQPLIWNQKLGFSIDSKKGYGVVRLTYASTSKLEDIKLKLHAHFSGRPLVKDSNNANYFAKANNYPLIKDKLKNEIASVDWLVPIKSPFQQNKNVEFKFSSDDLSFIRIISIEFLVK